MIEANIIRSTQVGCATNLMYATIIRNINDLLNLP